MRGGVSLKHRVEYAAFRAALATGNLLSEENAARVGAALGRLGFPLRIKRDVVEANLRIAFPSADDEWIRRVARASYEHVGRETMMMLRLATQSRAALLARTRVVNLDAGVDVLRRGRGLVVVAGHLGNWEIGAAMVAARGYPVDVIAKRARNPLFYQSIVDARTRMGIRIIDFKRAPKHALRALRAGRAVAFAADQHAGRSGIRVPFFGRPAATYRGPAVLALRTGAPVFLSIPLRLPDGSYELTLEPIPFAPSGDLERDVWRLTAAYTARLEHWVRQYPEQYLWHHRRWRGSPPPGPTYGSAAAAEAGTAEGQEQEPSSPRRGIV